MRLDPDGIGRRMLQLVRTDGHEGAAAGPLPDAPWFTLADPLAKDVDPQAIVGRAPRG